MDGFSLYCELTYGTSLDPRINRHKKRKLKTYKGNKRKRAQEIDVPKMEESISSESVLGKQCSIDDNCSGSDDSDSNPVVDSPKEKTPRTKSPRAAMPLLKLAKIRKEEVTHYRRIHRIYVTGSDIPDPVEEFKQLFTDYEVCSNLIENITQLGYTSPTPIQMQAIPLLLHRRNILACAPTGSGKTAAFLIPLMHNLKVHKKSGFRALILAPTRELAKQIYIVCVHLHKGTKLKTLIIEDVMSATENPASLKKYDILISTPNRLVHMLQHEPPVICLENVRWLIVDECDKLFETGKKGFREQLATIYKACDSANITRALFSATFSHDVEEWCKLNFDSVATVSIGVRNTAVESIKQELLFVGCEGGKLLALRDILKKGILPPVMVFVQSKERAQELFSELVYDDVRVDVTHSDLDQEQRNRVITKFVTGKIWVLICTELLARGIDFKGVNLVINYDFPPTAISYIHRIGRTGRAGEQGRAVTFFTNEDMENLRGIAQVMKNAGCDVPEYIMKMKKGKRKNKNTIIMEVKREKISTVPKYSLQKERKKKQLIQNSRTKVKGRKLLKVA